MDHLIFSLSVSKKTGGAPCEHTIDYDVALGDCSGVIGFDSEDGGFCGGVFDSSCCEHDYGFPC